MPGDIRRFNIDIRLACEAYGESNVFWPRDGSFIVIENFQLPSNFRSRQTNMIVLVPENYGHNGCYRDIFVDPGLELLDASGRDYRLLDQQLHGFREYPYSTMSPEAKRIFRERNWFYLCLHDKDPKSSLLNYLFKVKVFLGNPYKDWKSIADGYRKA